MKIYKVLQIVVNYGRSLTPTLGGTVRPPSRSVLAGYPEYTRAYRNMIRLGYSDPQVMIMFQRWFVYNTGTMGLTAAQAWRVVQSQVNVMIDPGPPPIVSSFVVYAVGVAVVLLVAKSLISPMDFILETIDAPDTMYVFANEETLWLGELMAVSPGGRGLYEWNGGVGGPLIAHRKHVPYAPDFADQMLFGGTVLWKGWKLPYFRRYYHIYWWVKYLDVVDWQFGSMYYLKHNANDPFLPSAPYIRPGGARGQPTYDGIYKDFPWNVVPT